jgi:hypothetical protein
LNCSLPVALEKKWLMLSHTAQTSHERL